MATHLITGYAGYEHIQSEDDGAFNAAFFGGGQYVMAFGSQFEGSIIDNNTVRILDGDGLMYGRHFRIKPNTYEDVTITTGTAGTNRVDLIVMTYEKNENDGTEQAYLEVIMGAESEGTARTPEYANGNILEGATFNQMPLYKVTISGVVLEDIEPLFDVIKTYKDLAKEAEAEFKEACETHLDSLGVLDTMEEVEANTQGKQLAGALAVKEGFDSLNETLANINVYVDDGGALHFVDKDGADSVLPFSNLDISYLGICHAKTNTCAQAAIVTMPTGALSQSYVAQANATSKNNGVLNMATYNSTSLAVATAYALKKGTYLYIATTNASTYKGMSLLAVGIKELSDDVSTTLCSVSNAVDVSLFVAKLN